ncbi:hypothetical protein ACHAWT_010391 [Skeletonema menzelii]
MPPPESLCQIIDASFGPSLLVLSNGQIWHMNDSTRGLFALSSTQTTSISTHLSFLTSSHVTLTWNEVTLPGSFHHGKKMLNGVVVTTNNNGGENTTTTTPVKINIVRMTAAPETCHEECYFCLYLKEIETAPSRVSSTTPSTRASLEEEWGRLSITSKETAADGTILKLVLDASFHALFVINEKGIIQLVNEKSCEVFGWSRSEFLGSNIHIIMPADVAPRHDQYLQNYLKTGMKKMIGTQREVTAQRKDGSTFPCVLGLSEVSKESGLICGFIRDLTSEKTLEERNENLEERNEANTHTIKVQRKGLLVAEDTILGILDASFHALFVINEKGIIQLVNEKSCEVFGWSKEEMVSQNINMIMPSDVASSHDQYLQNYLKTGIKKMIGTQREVNAQRKDGTTFPCVLGLSEVSKESGLICGFIRDLTSEKQIQIEVGENHKLMLKIMDASFHALFVINEEGIIQMVNERSTKVLGWTKEEFIGHNITMIMPHEHAHQHGDYLKRYLTTGRKRMIGKEREVSAKRKDGTTFPCILGLSEIDTSDGTKLFVGFLEDITVQKSLIIAEAEREASDNLLHNILPEHIANRLKQDPSHIADHYENTTILFADIVGFTNKTSSMTPKAVVTMLNNLFSQFDYLVGHYDLNKVKTIGDCYMVTSIPSSEIDSGCSRVCMFALDLLKCVQKYNMSGPQHGHLDMRVGIACGQVVAGVVGTKRFLFDMWGDAVNVAARMEQHGLPGKIQVTKEVVDNCYSNDFSFELRGTLNIKGKGMLDCYFLKSASEKLKKPSSRRSVFTGGSSHKPLQARSDSA